MNRLRALAAEAPELMLTLSLLLAGCSIRGSNRSPAGTAAGATAAPATPSATATAPSPSPTASATTTQAPSPAAMPSSTPTASPTHTAIPDAVLIAAGDIAGCASSGDEATASLVEGMAGTVAGLGDMAYVSGSAAQFAACYEPSWGRFKDRTRPAPGNHDYLTPGASAYFGYFGSAAGEPGQGYYSYDLGAWHIVALNSLCWEVGGCGRESPQVQWLRADLEAHSALCTLAYWHFPRFSSGLHGSYAGAQTLWATLSAAGVDVALAGHDHDYERFAPMDAAGAPDPANGVREFVVGTGGYSHYPFPGAPLPTTEVRNAQAFGVLKLTLHPTSYDWEFVPVAGQTFTDSGSTACH